MDTMHHRIMTSLSGDIEHYAHTAPLTSDTKFPNGTRGRHSIFDFNVPRLPSRSCINYRVDTNAGRCIINILVWHAITLVAICQSSSRSFTFCLEKCIEICGRCIKQIPRNKIGQVDT